MSKHWNPEDELARWNGADEQARPKKPSWPEGATAGLVLVALSCLAIGAMFYQVAGPREVIEEDVSRR